MKAHRTKREVRIQVGDGRPRLFLVPKKQADNIVRLLEDFEIFEIEENASTEPGVMLRGARVKEGISQTELALRLGIPPSNISEMECGKRPIGKNMAKRLSAILKINYKVFL